MTHGWRSPISCSILCTLASFVVTGVLKPSAVTEMVLGYNAAYSSKVKNIARECTRIHLLHMTVKKISGEGDSPVLKLPLVGGVYHAPTASHLPQTWGPVFSVPYVATLFATTLDSSLPGRFARYLDGSPPGRFAPLDVSIPGRFATSLDSSPPVSKLVICDSVTTSENPNIR